MKIRLRKIWFIVLKLFAQAINLLHHFGRVLTLINHLLTGHNMSVLGSQVDVDMDESVPDPVPKHQGHTGTGCYKLHDHEFLRPRHRPGGRGGGEERGPPTNPMDLPLESGPAPTSVQLNTLKHSQHPAQPTPVSIASSVSRDVCRNYFFLFFNIPPCIVVL